MAWADVAGPAATWDDLGISLGEVLLIAENGDYITTEDGFYIKLNDAGTWAGITGPASVWTAVAGP